MKPVEKPAMNPAKEMNFSRKFLVLTVCAGLTSVLVAPAAEGRGGSVGGRQVKPQRRLVASHVQHDRVIERQQETPAQPKAKRPHKKSALELLPPRLRSQVLQLAKRGLPGVAALDADGTLWGGDVGEGFFVWMLSHRYYPAAKIPLLTQAWHGYKAGTFAGEKMYELMVTGLAGMRERDVQTLADRYFRSHRHRIYKPMRHLVQALGQLRITPWVVSGSPYWVVAAGAKYFGIPKRHVIALSVAVDENGRLTNRVVRPVPWKRGKAQRIAQDIGQMPLLVAGNSRGDLQMLRIARDLRLVINPGPGIREHARQQAWAIHSYTRTDELASIDLGAPAAAE